MPADPTQSRPAKLSPNEMAIMNVLWDRGEATGREVLEHLEAPMALTTLLTYLSRLEGKGYVKRQSLFREAESETAPAAGEAQPGAPGTPGAHAAHGANGNGGSEPDRSSARYIYQPAVRRISVASRLLDQVVRHFDNRLSSLVSHFVKTRPLSDEERRRLRDVLDHLDEQPPAEGEARPK